MSLIGLILVFALPSVSAISLSISASGWPPCPASTDTSYTITVRVTGSTPNSTFLRIGIWDYIENRYIAETDAINVSRGRIDVTRRLTIRTPRVAGEISYMADVRYRDPRTGRWIRGSSVDSGTRMAGTPSANIVNVRIEPSPLTIPSPTRDVTGERNVRLSWTLQGTTTRLRIHTRAYYVDNVLFVSVPIGEYVERNVTRSFSESFSVTHRPRYAGRNNYSVVTLYYDWCSRNWRTLSNSTTNVHVECRAVTYQPGRWNDDNFTRINNNCYNYGTDIQTNTFAQPGKGGRGINYELPWNASCDVVINAAIADGLIHMGWDIRFSCPSCSHKVALAVMPASKPKLQGGEWDYHWYREDDRSGFWSHKPGMTNATDRVNIDRRVYPIINTNRITNPEAAASFIRYTSFCGYFCVPKTTVNIIGNQTIWVR